MVVPELDGIGLLDPGRNKTFALHGIPAVHGEIDKGDLELSDVRHREAFGIANFESDLNPSTDQRTDQLRDAFDLEAEGEALGKRLRFLSTLARLWQIAARREGMNREALIGWLAPTERIAQSRKSWPGLCHRPRWKSRSDIARRFLSTVKRRR